VTDHRIVRWDLRSRSS